MKAVLRKKYGAPDVLSIEDVKAPVPTAKEVLVKVYATTVNRTDCSILTGKPWVMRLFVGLWKPKRIITGTDFAGQVEAIGEDVTEFRVGDRVFGLNDEGLSSHAEYMTIEEDQAIGMIPKSITYAQAAASAEGAHYAYNFLNKISLKKGDKVLVNGATGAIGSAAIQLLLLEDVEITAVCDAKSVSVIESLGVHEVINYQERDFTKIDKKFQFVFDAVGKSRFKFCKSIMTSDGVYVSSELGPSAENIFLALIKRRKDRQRVIFPIPVNTKRSIRHMSDLLARKAFKPLIDRIYPIEDIAEAFRFVQTGMKTGNVILKIVPPAELTKM